MTVEETIATAIDQFVAGCVAEQEAEENIIPFPRPHPHAFIAKTHEHKLESKRTVRG